MMRIQPFMILKKEYIPRLIQLGKIYLVTQTYQMNASSDVNEPKTHLLITSYDSPLTAKTHLSALKGDKWAAIINLGIKEHKDKLEEMLSPASKYILYWAVVKNKELLEKQINKQYADKIKNFIAQHTTWRISRDASIYPTLELIYGELFVNIKFGQQRLKFKFEDLKMY